LKTKQLAFSENQKEQDNEKHVGITYAVLYIFTKCKTCQQEILQNKYTDYLCLYITNTPIASLRKKKGRKLANSGPTRIG
jgi:hypothetical protein